MRTIDYAGCLRAGVMAFVLMIAMPGAVLAVLPDEMLADPVLEARAREVSQGLRCLVCQNQSIDESDAPLARDLRLLVRERLRAGDTDEQAVDYIVARYGTFVLLRPPLQPDTVLLWVGPGLFVLSAALALLFYYRRRRPGAAPAPLSPEERAHLGALMEEERDA